MRKALLVMLAMITLISFVITASTVKDVCDYINKYLRIPSTSKGPVCEGFTEGINGGRITADDALNFLKEINNTSWDTDCRGKVAQTIAQAFKEDLPGQWLMLKVQQGMKIPQPAECSEISWEIEEWKRTFADIKLLLDQKGIKVGIDVSSVGDTTKLTLEVIDEVIKVITETLEAYVIREEEESLEDCFAIRQEVINALKGDNKIPPGVISLLDADQSKLAEELCQIAQDISKRRAKQKGGS